MHPITLQLPFAYPDPATTKIYTLSLHDALPIYKGLTKDARLIKDAMKMLKDTSRTFYIPTTLLGKTLKQDRKSTRLNSSHVAISYAVFCLKKKNKNTKRQHRNTAIRTTRKNTKS